MVLGVIGLIVGGVFLMRSNSQDEVVEREEFRLSEEMYEEGKFEELTATEFEELVAAKKSSVVILHMVVCPAEFPITDVAKQFARQEGVTIYGLTEEEFRKTELAEIVKYLPSAVIYREGRLVDFLDAEADEDLEYYKTVDGLKEWLEINGVGV